MKLFKKFAGNAVGLCIVCFVVVSIKGYPFDHLAESSQCSGTQSCSTHQVSCTHNKRIVLHMASYGFTSRDDNWNFRCEYSPCRDPDTCCNKGRRTFCIVAFSDAHLKTLTDYCTGKTSCVFPAPTGIDPNICGANYYQYSTSTFFRYSCVDGDHVFDTRYNKIANRTDSASILINQSEFDTRQPHSAVCTISPVSRLQNATITMYSFSVLSSVSAQWSVRVQSKNSLYMFDPAWFQGGTIPSVLARTITSIETPVVVNVNIPSNNYPDLFWLWFEGEFNKLTMECTPVPSSCRGCKEVSTTTITTTTTTTTPTTTSKATQTTRAATKTPFTGTPTTGGDTEGLNGATKTEEQQEGTNITGIIAGSVVAAVVGLAVAAVVGFVLCRRRSRRQKAEEICRLNALPSRSMLEDDGYCVPVTSAFGIKPGVGNLGYVDDSGDDKTVGAKSSSTFQGQGSSLNRSENLYAGEDFGDYGEMYEDLHGSGNEDVESGIDDDSFDSEFEEVAPPSSSQPFPADRVVSGGHGTIGGENGAQSPDNPVAGEQVYFELESEYYNLPTAISSTSDVEASAVSGGLPTTFSAQQLIGSESSISLQQAGSVVPSAPDYPLPSEPIRGGFLDAMRHEAKNVKNKIRGLIPKRKRFIPAQHGKNKHSDISFVLPSSEELSVPASFALTSASNTTSHSFNAAARMSLSSGHAQRQLPVVPHQTARNSTATNDASGEPVYLKAKFVDEGDNCETIFSLKPSALESGNRAGMKSMAAEDHLGRQEDLQNRMPRGIITELQKLSNIRTPSGGLVSATTSSDSSRHGNNIDEKQADTDFGEKRNEQKKAKCAYTEVCKKKKFTPADEKPTGSGTSRTVGRDGGSQFENEHKSTYNRTTTSTSNETRAPDPSYDHVTLPDDVFLDDGSHDYYNLDDVTGEQEEC